MVWVWLPATHQNSLCRQVSFGLDMWWIGLNRIIWGLFTFYLPLWLAIAYSLWASWPETMWGFIIRHCQVFGCEMGWDLKNYLTNKTILKNLNGVVLYPPRGGMVFDPHTTQMLRLLKHLLSNSRSDLIWIKLIYLASWSTSSFILTTWLPTTWWGQGNFNDF